MSAIIVRRIMRKQNEINANEAFLSYVTCIQKKKTARTHTRTQGTLARHCLRILKHCLLCRIVSTWVGFFFSLMLCLCLPRLHTFSTVSSAFHSLLLSLVIKITHRLTTLIWCLSSNVTGIYSTHNMILYAILNLRNCYRRRLRGMWLKFFFDIYLCVICSESTKIWKFGVWKWVARHNLIYYKRRKKKD